MTNFLQLITFFRVKNIFFKKEDNSEHVNIFRRIFSPVNGLKIVFIYQMISSCNIKLDETSNHNNPKRLNKNKLCIFCYTWNLPIYQHWFYVKDLTFHDSASIGSKLNHERVIPGTPNHKSWNCSSCLYSILSVRLKIGHNPEYISLLRPMFSKNHDALSYRTYSVNNTKQGKS